jgi:hypothetical protein
MSAGTGRLLPMAAELCGLLEFFQPPPGQHHGETGVHQRQRCCAPDPGAGAGYHRDLVFGFGHLLPAC